MNESHIKINIDEELLEDYTSGFYEESFESLKESSFTLKRFNLICEKVYERISSENGIFSFIIAFASKYYSFFYKKKHVIKIYFYNHFYTDDKHQDTPHLWFFFYI